MNCIIGKCNFSFNPNTLNRGSVRFPMRPLNEEFKLYADVVFAVQNGKDGWS